MEKATLERENDLETAGINFPTENGNLSNPEVLLHTVTLMLAEIIPTFHRSVKSFL